MLQFVVGECESSAAATGRRCRGERTAIGRGPSARCRAFRYVVEFVLIIVAACVFGSAVSPAAAQTIQYIHDEVGNVVEVRRLAAGELAILQFSPLSGPTGTVVTIDGQGFNATPGSNAVTFNGTTATIVSGTTRSWSCWRPRGRAPVQFRYRMAAPRFPPTVAS
jgi:hypothetical protein